MRLTVSEVAETPQNHPLRHARRLLSPGWRRIPHPRQAQGRRTPRPPRHPRPHHDQLRRRARRPAQRRLHLTPRGPVQIDRKDQERIITVAANIAGRDLGSIFADIQAELAQLPIPADFTIVYGGDYEEQQKAFRELLVSIILALVLVYMVMACQYESLRDPFVVMFSVPLAAIGVVLMLFLTRTTFNIQSYIGCIMLGGIVVNNAILLVDHTNLLRRRDKLPLREAIEEAGRRRLRPILMTASTTMLGLAPLALGLGEGGEAQAPLARAVIGGLLSSTLITLVFVPVVYSLFERGLKKTPWSMNNVSCEVPLFSLGLDRRSCFAAALSFAAPLQPQQPAPPPSPRNRCLHLGPRY